MLDTFDLKILALLQDDSSLTNAALADRINLSASQCSRRRSALEASGHIRGYRADLDARKLGYEIEAFTRVTLAAHDATTARDFAAFVSNLKQVQQAHAVSGEADYLIHIRVKNLEDLAEFIHGHLLPHKHVSQVRSDIVLRTIKVNRGFSL